MARSLENENDENFGPYLTQHLTTAPTITNRTTGATPPSISNNNTTNSGVVVVVDKCQQKI